MKWLIIIAFMIWAITVEIRLMILAHCTETLLIRREKELDLEIERRRGNNE